jgi:hypothetical protein
MKQACAILLMMEKIGTAMPLQKQIPPPSAPPLEKGGIGKPIAFVIFDIAKYHPNASDSPLYKGGHRGDLLRLQIR